MKRGIILISMILGLACCEKASINPLSDNELNTDNYRLVKILNYGSTSDSEPNTFVDIEYDSNGNLIKESLYDYPNTLFTYRKYYYENNLLKEKRVYDGQVGNLQLGTYRVYQYENSKLIKEELFLSDGTSKYTKHYEYDGDNLVKSGHVGYYANIIQQTRNDTLEEAAGVCEKQNFDGNYLCKVGASVCAEEIRKIKETNNDTKR